MIDFDPNLLDEQVGPFSSVQEELDFWKTRSGQLKAALLDTQRTLNEFQQDSREYEEELERTVEVTEAQCKELRNAVSVLQIEVNHWKEKYQEAKVDSNLGAEAMQREINYLKTSHEKYKDRTRTLEQDNDDLERFGRVATSSLKDIELRLNQTLERNIFLENELDIKNKLVIVVQRLKEELRDLQLEISVLRNNRPSNQLKRRSLSVKLGQDAAHPVKMVQDMLGRVKSLENRLVNGRTLVPPSLRSSSHANSTKSTKSTKSTASTKSTTKNATKNTTKSTTKSTAKSTTKSRRSSGSRTHPQSSVSPSPPTSATQSKISSTRSRPQSSVSPSPTTQSKLSTSAKTRSARTRSILMESLPNRLRRVSGTCSRRTTLV